MSNPTQGWVDVIPIILRASEQPIRDYRDDLNLGRAAATAIQCGIYGVEGPRRPPPPRGAV
jgi:hypothetical protein